MDAEEVFFLLTVSYHSCECAWHEFARSALPWLWILLFGINIFPLSIFLFSCNKMWESYCLFSLGEAAAKS